MASGPAERTPASSAPPEIRGPVRFLLGPWPFFPRTVTVIFLVVLAVRAAGRAAAMSIDTGGTFRVVAPNMLTALVGAAAAGALYWGVPRAFDRVRPRRGAMGRPRYIAVVILIAVVLAVLLHVVTRVLFRDHGADEDATVAVSLGFSTPGLILGLLLLNGLLGRIEAALRRQERMLEQQLTEVRGQRHAVLAAEERIRSEIASALHDDVQTRLLRATMRLGAARDELPSGQRAVIDEVIDELEETREEGIRAIGRRLAPSIDATGLLPALRESAAGYARAMRVECAFDDAIVARFGPTAGPQPAALAIYRVAEQALQNALKHGRAGQVRLSLTQEPSGACVLVVDADGRSPSAQRVPGEGTRVIEAWMAEVGGTWVLEAGPAGGSRFSARFGG